MKDLSASEGLCKNVALCNMTKPSCFYSGGLFQTRHIIFNTQIHGYASPSEYSNCVTTCIVAGCYAHLIVNSEFTKAVYF